MFDDDQPEPDFTLITLMVHPDGSVEVDADNMPHSEVCFALLRALLTLASPGEVSDDDDE